MNANEDNRSVITKRYQKGRIQESAWKGCPYRYGFGGTKFGILGTKKLLCEKWKSVKERMG